MSLGTLFSRIIGFVRDAVVAALFDRTVTDVFSAAFALPNFFRRFLGEGALSVSFIPIFSEKLYGQDLADEAARKARAKQLSSAVMSLLMLVSFVVTALLFVFMESIIRGWLGEEEFLKIPGKLELAVALSRITIFYLMLVTLYAYFMAIAQALNKFFLPALAPAFFNLFFVFTVFVPDAVFPNAEQKLAWAVIVGGVVQLALVVWQLAKLGFLPRLTFHVRTPGVGLVLKNMAPGLLGLGAAQIMTIVNQKFAAGLSEGAMTHVYYVNRLLELPQSLIAISIGTALLPTLSQMHSQGKTQEMLVTTFEQVKFLLFLSLPASLGLYLLAEPIVALLFERGRWTAVDTESVALLTKIIGLTLIFGGITRVIVPSFYAVKNTRLPAGLSIATVAFHVVTAPLLIESLGLSGLIWSVSFSSLFGLIMTAIFYRRLIGPMYWGRIIGYCGKLLPALLVLGSFCFFIYEAIFSHLQVGLGVQGARLIGVAVCVSIGGVLYFLVGQALGVREARMVLDRVRRRFKR